MLGGAGGGKGSEGQVGLHIPLPGIPGKHGQNGFIPSFRQVVQDFALQQSLRKFFFIFFVLLVRLTTTNVCCGLGVLPRSRRVGRQSRVGAAVDMLDMRA